MLKMWACQVLCMISEYHMACVTRGLPVTSPILPKVIEDQLPSLAGYTLPEDRLGVMDVRVRDHQAKTLRVAIWLHTLDMALSRELAASRSLVQAQHSLGHLLTYFLAPGTAWGLQFEDVVNQVLQENREQNERRQNKLSSSLSKCRSRRTKLRDEFDAVSKTLEITTDWQARKEMEQRLAACRPPSMQLRTPSPSLRTSLRIAGWWRKRLIGLRRRRPTRASLALERGLPTSKWLIRKNVMTQSPLAPIWRPTPRTTLRRPQVGIPFPQRKRRSSWVKHPNLRITAPGARPPWSQEGWQSYISHPQPTRGLRRERPHNRSLPFSDKP